MSVPPPPLTRCEDVVDVVHGVPVADPYRWLEDGTDPEVRAWTTAQNDRTRAVLDALPDRGPLHARLSELLSVRVVSGGQVAGGRLFTVERGGGLDQAALFVRSALGAPDERPHLLIDPQALLDDATAALDWYHPSPDGALVAFGTSVGGDERSTLRLLEVASGELLDDAIPNTRAASVAWLPGGGAFAYTRYHDPAAVPLEERGYHRTVWWHELGAHPGHDELVYGDLPDRTAWPEVSLSRDGRWLLIHVALGWDRIDVHLVDRSTGANVTVIEGVDAVTSFEVIGDRLVGITTLDALSGPGGGCSLATPTVGHWTTLVLEGRSVLQGMAITDRSLLVRSTRSAVSRLDHYDLLGGEHREVPLPGKGTVVSLDASHDRDEAWLALTSFALPPRLYRWTPDGLGPWGGDDTAVDADAFVIEQVRYPSTDGTDVAMFLVRHRDVEPGPSTPTILTAYGGFAVTLAPEYSASVVAHCERGGLWAQANIRGGAEEGEDWHRAGTGRHKQQVFDDFLAAADWLVAEGRTSRERLAVRGGSNGGLLVAAALTQRPDLCRAVHCAVPLTDMVRYPLFLIARLWVPEYGDPADPEAFGWLHAYSPYHHVTGDRCYPSLLVTTGEEDSRVDPCHARKFAAAVQAATACGDEQPVLVRVESRAGHGQGKPVSRQADEAADVLAFLHWQLSRERVG
ncbi:MAG: prolyl oligopeptidase family serine peptidase [Acidimicrobiales bacterium]